VSFAVISLCVASQRVFIIIIIIIIVVVVVVYFVMTQSGNFWIHPRISYPHNWGRWVSAHKAALLSYLLRAIIGRP
jgi:uncharacterized protein involved in cysteine biosynthesis